MTVRAYVRVLGILWCICVARGQPQSGGRRSFRMPSFSDILSDNMQLENAVLDMGNTAPQIQGPVAASHNEIQTQTGSAADVALQPGGSIGPGVVEGSGVFSGANVHHTAAQPASALVPVNLGSVMPITGPVDSHSEILGPVGFNDIPVDGSGPFSGSNVHHAADHPPSAIDPVNLVSTMGGSLNINPFNEPVFPSGTSSPSNQISADGQTVFSSTSVGQHLSEPSVNLGSPFGGPLDSNSEILGPVVHTDLPGFRNIPSDGAPVVHLGGHGTGNGHAQEHAPVQPGGNVHSTDIGHPSSTFPGSVHGDISGLHDVHIDRNQNEIPNLGTPMHPSDPHFDGSSSILGSVHIDMPGHHGVPIDGEPRVHRDNDIHPSPGHIDTSLPPSHPRRPGHHPNLHPDTSGQNIDSGGTILGLANDLNDVLVAPHDPSTVAPRRRNRWRNRGNSPEARRNQLARQAARQERRLQRQLQRQQQRQLQLQLQQERQQNQNIGTEPNSLMGNLMNTHNRLHNGGRNIKIVRSTTTTTTSTTTRPTTTTTTTTTAAPTPVAAPNPGPVVIQNGRRNIFGNLDAAAGLLGSLLAAARPIQPVQPGFRFGPRPMQPGFGFGPRPMQPGFGFGPRPMQPGPRFGPQPRQPANPANLLGNLFGQMMFG